jgi:hypothetical protein
MLVWALVGILLVAVVSVIAERLKKGKRQNDLLDDVNE